MLNPTGLHRRFALRILAPCLATAATLALAKPAEVVRQAPDGRFGVAVRGCVGAGLSFDEDHDGLSTTCEEALAAAFAPELLADPADCLWDRAGDRLAGAYLHAVHPLSATGDSVRLAFMPAYQRDCGWRGLQRVLRLGRENAHAGDSELILLDVRRDRPGTWRTVGVFLSAHCFGRSDGRCRWFRESDLADFAWSDDRPGAPLVWVARDKHANYPSRASCESGHWFQERCSGTPKAYRFPVAHPHQNVGSRGRPRFGAEGCVPAEGLPLPVPESTAGAIECLWSRSAEFRGWRRDHPGSARPYGLLLHQIGGL